MRQLTTEDLHRLILVQAASESSSSDLDPWKSGKHGVHGRLQFQVDEEVENRIVSAVLGSLTYRTREQIRRLLTRLAQWPISGKRELDMMEYWAGIGSKYFDFVETFYVKPPLFETWRRQMHAADEDLPALAWLSTSQSLPLRDRVQQHLSLFDQWPTFIRGNDPQLYRELAKGYGCLHLHLSGSYPAPFFWIGLMNRRFEEKHLLDQSEATALRGYRTVRDLQRLVTLVGLARTARSKLLKYVSGRHNEEALNRRLSECSFLENDDEENMGTLGAMTDFAQADVVNWDKATCPSLIGERYLLFRVLRVIHTSKETDLVERLSRILWAYIVAKHAFLSTVQQAEGTAGFDYFEHTFRLVRWRMPSVEQKCAEEIGNFLQETGALVKLELMIAPREKAADYQKDLSLAAVILKQLDDRLSRSVRESYGKPRVGLIVHFIKDHGEPLDKRLTKDGDAYRAYHHGVRDRVTSQFDQLLKHLDESPEGPVAICGIDAANRELFCPPEIFAEVFRRAVPELRRRAGNRLQTFGRTFHVGEDFAHMGTGLRRIYEALTFLDLRPGDRLGHACALGLDPSRWAMMNPSVEMHLIDILDDAVFEAVLLRARTTRVGGIDERRMSELIRTIDECCVEVFGTTIPLVQLEKAWRLRALTSRNNAKEFQDDDSVPKWVRNQHQKFKSHGYESAGSHSLVLHVREIADPGITTVAGAPAAPPERLPSDTAERIAIEYNHDIRTIRRFLKIKTIDTTQTVAHLVALQSAVAEEANNRGIVIESNPSSNWLIGGLDSHAELPAVRWLTTGEDEGDRVSFTINSDDPTVFASSIENEYFMVFSAAVHSARSLSRVECLREIASLRERSLHASFLD